MKIRFDHIMMHTTCIEESIKFFQQVLGMTLDNTDDYDTFRLAYLKDEATNIKFELREVFGQEKQPNGNVLGHFAFYVDDIKSVIKSVFHWNEKEITDEEAAEVAANVEPHEIVTSGFYKYEHHVSSKHGKEYLIFTFWSPDGVELSALQKVVG